ncbi:MAG: L-threonylcarbamoyladenylate synthase [bacterium]|nr:L-threonylcarbamoyladenylate synthase [bacterium]
MGLSTDKDLVNTILSGGIAVIPTDTLYGIVVRANNEEAIERLCALRGREIRKPCIILVEDAEAIDQLYLHIPMWAQTLMQRVWPGPLSLVFDATIATPDYLHRGRETLAVRVPANDDLRKLLHKTGPLLAPSANPAGLPTATTVAWAQQYFRESVDYYFDRGYVGGQPSTVAKVTEKGLVLVREGSMPIENLREYLG